MIRYGDLYNAHQQARFMRPDAHRWSRPDAARWLKPPHPDEEKYSPSQPRDWRGRWTDGGGGSGRPSAQPMGQINFRDLPNFSDVFGLFQITPSDTPLDGVQLAGDDGKPLLDSFGEPYYAPKGHHELPKSVFKAWDLPEETARVFDRATTGQLPAGRTEIEGKLRGHLWDDEHRKYSEAVRELTERFMKERDIIPSRMTPEQAKDLLREIRDSENSSIRDYNRIMRMLRRIFRGGRE